MPTIMKEQMEVSIRVTPQQAFDFIKQQVDANEGFDEDTRPVRVHDSAYLQATSGELMSSAVCVIFDCNIYIDVAERMLRRA